MKLGNFGFRTSKLHVWVFGSISAGRFQHDFFAAFCQLKSFSNFSYKAGFQISVDSVALEINERLLEFKLTI